VTEATLPETLTLDDAFRAAFYLTEQYVALETRPDSGLVLYFQYLRSDPARWEDWKRAVRRAIEHDVATDPLTDNLRRDD
jgi:hypothetical protein